MEMSEFQQRIRAVFDTANERSDRVKQLLGKTDDLASLVLRGHLVLEELLFAAVEAHCQQPKHLTKARLRFPQLVLLLRALEKIPVLPEEYWEALLELNALRNSLAHKLEPKDLESRISSFAARLADANPPEGVPKPGTSREALEFGLYYLMGAFEVVAVWHAALEELIHHRSTANA
jgi:hypothetical protein